MTTFHVLNSPHPCTELVLEVNHLRSYLSLNGYAVSPDLGQADIILVSTCAFNEEYEEDALQSIHRALGERKPGAKIIVTGCLSGINPGTFGELRNRHGIEDVPPLGMEKIETIAPPIDASNAVPVAEIVPNSVTLEEYRGHRDMMTGIRLKRFYRALRRYLRVPLPAWLYPVPMPDSFYIRSGTGCLGRCSYCAIRRAKGRIKSQELGHIVDQVKRAVSQGVTDIYLAGDDLGCWGQDVGLSLPDLLREVVRVEGRFEVDLRYVEPEYLVRYYDALLPSLMSGKIASLSTPIQSGSQRIVDLMRRNYDVGEVVKITNEILRSTRVKSIGSIMMAGFPTETLDDFRASFDLIRRSRISLWQILRYEGKPDTASRLLEPKVDDGVKDRRTLSLRQYVMLRNYVHVPDRLSRAIVRMKSGHMV